MADTRLTLRQAAAVLGVSESAIRKRVERGTLRSDKGLDGRRYVCLDTVADSVADEGPDVSAPMSITHSYLNSGHTMTRYERSWRPSARAMLRPVGCWLPHSSGYRP